MKLWTPQNQKPPLGAQINWGDPITDGLAGAWILNEGSGNKVFDLSGNDNHGTLTNMVPTEDWVAGPDDWALDFDGSDDSVAIPMAFAEPFTMAVVGYARADISVFISAGDSGNPYYHALMYQTSFGPLSARTFGGAVVDATATGSLNTWYNLVGVWASSASRSLYVDGVLKDTDTNAQSVTVNQVRIGVTADSTPVGYADAIIVMAMVWSRALSAEEVVRVAGL